MKGALDIHRALLARGVLHDIVRLPRLIVRAEQLPSALGLPAAACLHVLVFRADDTIVAVTAGGDASPDPGAVLAEVGARELSIPDADEISAATDYAAGLVAPVLLPAGVVRLWDAGIPADQIVYTPTGESGTALAISSRWLGELSAPRVGRFCTRAAAAQRTLPPDRHRLAPRISVERPAGPQFVPVPGPATR